MSSETGNEPLPNIFYVFVDRAGFRTRNNFEKTGRFVSSGFSAAFPEMVPAGTISSFAPGPASPGPSGLRDAYEGGTIDYLQFAPNPTFFGWPSPFADATVAGYRLEYDAEVSRRSYFPLKPSRLSAIFAFGDLETCQLVSDHYGWSLSEVRRFRLIPHEHNRWTRVNMEIISLMRYSYPKAMWTADDLDQVWRSYWGGDPELRVSLSGFGAQYEERSSGCIWEYLIEGVLERVG